MKENEELKEKIFTHGYWAENLKNLNYPEDVYNMNLENQDNENY